jgi:hypothetical protein
VSGEVGIFHLQYIDCFEYPMAVVEGIYVSPEGAAPMESRDAVDLVKGSGIAGDRYAIGNGTYSARFFGEPGRQLTMVSGDAIEDAMVRHSMVPLTSMGELRRNLVLRGISSAELNDMVGREVTICRRTTSEEESRDDDDGVAPVARLFVHRRTVPCKKTEAGCERSGMMNKLWDDCGVNCEVLASGTIRLGDEVRVVAENDDGDDDPRRRRRRRQQRRRRANPGQKPPAFFVRPSDRTAEQARGMIIPPHVAAIMCMIDPSGFVRVEHGYNSVGQRFFSTRAYRAGMLVRALRVPLLIAMAAIFVAMALRMKDFIR